MIMQQVDLYDLVTLRCIPESEVRLTCSDDFLPVDDKNIAFRAAENMRKKYDIQNGFEIHIEKNIPVSAGLAGGSTDAAAVIKGINRLCGLGLSEKTMMAIGFELGADVPFCIMEGCALAEGLGEKLTPIRGFEHAWMVLVKPNFGVSTKEVYTALKYETLKGHPDTQGMLSALESQKRHDILDRVYNVLEEVTLKLYPGVVEAKRFLAGHGAEGVLMSGSGPTVFGFYKSYERAKNAQKKIKKHYSQSYVVTTYNKHENRRSHERKF
jgi:4-diphosphocytidyl-2-C-methyl-D-erythritol kinase